MDLISYILRAQALWGNGTVVGQGEGSKKAEGNGNLIFWVRKELQ